MDKYTCKYVHIIIRVPIHSSFCLPNFALSAFFFEAARTTLEFEQTCSRPCSVEDNITMNAC